MTLSRTWLAGNEVRLLVHWTPEELYWAPGLMFVSVEWINYIFKARMWHQSLFQNALSLFFIYYLLSISIWKKYCKSALLRGNFKYNFAHGFRITQRRTYGPPRFTSRTTKPPIPSLGAKRNKTENKSKTWQYLRIFEHNPQLLQFKYKLRAKLLRVVNVYFTTL